MNTSTLQVLITAAALFAAPATALSEDAIHAPAQKTIGVAKQSRLRLSGQISANDKWRPAGFAVSAA